ncbi:uncharacterized protein CELE_C36A4.10 [Caenorhabditis elegans]|uniref:Uncharacterized protein n=1 Tax=Caenorhabditis elegans TaxID=6239 RepID=Q18497_CAEEL|nr:Uncharacterized protein CELE_C36A4.10 [Caenorhabditis elegans]CAA91276.2 Uncharacterized protein CELE_C36A4.10 [Caenorhabditis elegans]|eukprot:NP_497774.2 Uncharacterized protein CELE_C36A4.10 [Caenorhabditis elegans]
MVYCDTDSIIFYRISIYCIYHILRYGFQNKKKEDDLL